MGSKRIEKKFFMFDEFIRFERDYISILSERDYIPILSGEFAIIQVRYVTTQDIVIISEDHYILGSKHLNHLEVFKKKEMNLL